MLLKDFYEVKNIQDTGNGKYTAEIALNQGHEIFKGHFPGNPVMPGACMIQIIKEFTQHFLGYKIMMISAANVKFMALINPEKNPVLSLDFEISLEDDGRIKVKNTTRFDETVALKLSSVYSKI